MCGIVGYLRKTNDIAAPPLGAVSLEMLCALTERGPDSTGLALFAPAQNGEMRVRVKLGDDEPHPSVEHEVLEAVRAVTSINDAYREGECLHLTIEPVEATRLEQEILRAGPDVEVFGIGNHLELMKQVGHPDVLDRQFHIAEMEGTHFIGHTRLSTESRVDISHSQPFWTHGVTDLAVVHNGHITNYHKLRRHYERRGYRLYTENDSEIIGPYLQEQMKQGATLQEAMAQSRNDLDGTYCYLVASAEGLGFVKDFFCAKPLVYVETDDYVALATEEIAIRRAFPDAPAPIEAGANAWRFWSKG